MKIALDQDLWPTGQRSLATVERVYVGGQMRLGARAGVEMADPFVRMLLSLPDGTTRDLQFVCDARCVPVPGQRIAVAEDPSRPGVIALEVKDDWESEKQMRIGPHLVLQRPDQRVPRGWGDGIFAVPRWPQRREWLRRRNAATIARDRELFRTGTPLSAELVDRDDRQLSRDGTRPVAFTLLLDRAHETIKIRHHPTGGIPAPGVGYRLLVVRAPDGRLVPDTNECYENRFGRALVFRLGD